MNCTSCNQGELTPAFLEALFPCHTCDNCGGNLVVLTDYLKWGARNQQPEFVSDDSSEVAAEETSKAMICPITGRLMTKYRISKDIDHRLDLSPTASAIWMDKGEWKLLKEKGLAGKLNQIFTEHWQREIHSDQGADILAAMYQREFGDNYQTIKGFRDLVQSLDNKPEVIAYLLAEDPYSP